MKMTTAEIRRAFLDYFAQNQHREVASSSLIPADDPTLLFTNAGMVQFKRPLLGEEKRGYERACSSQKCMRAGGKHNDLENVGYTARHHTFFEMLGNFSFGDYFKEEAIWFAWEFLVDRMGLDKTKLFATVHEGDKELGIGPDEEAIEFWAKYLPRDRILAFPTSENFWAMGDTGPCGPCSEIIYDQGEEFSCGPGCRMGCECDRFLEVWNNVFMQFERHADGRLTPLPAQSIDTGMGLERLAAAIQGVPTNFHTDGFSLVIGQIESLAKTSHGADPKSDSSIRVIADHARAAAFLIADGVLPSNEWRGYVLRRVIRRGVRHGSLLGIESPFMSKVAAQVAKTYEDVYPEVTKNFSLVNQVLNAEEEMFSKTLVQGLRMLDEEVEKIRARGQTNFSGEVIFKLYDTYGIPVDVIIDTAKEIDFTVDDEGFETLMDERREASRKTWKGAELDTQKALGELSSQGVVTSFTGYDAFRGASTVLAVLTEGGRAKKAGPGQKAEVVTEETPFYGEAGGQVGDTGLISAEGLTFEVGETSRTPTGIFVHTGIVKEGEISEGMKVTLEVDGERRRAIQRNHCATHLLHKALQDRLGDHVRQKGSYVGPDRLRFDFTHFEAISDEELQDIENLVNRNVLENIPLSTRVVSLEEAMADGAMALFGEKYDEEVRMVEVAGVSKELCGGTHTETTDEVGLFKIVATSSVAAGVRRIEAVTGPAALEYLGARERLLKETSRMLKIPAAELPARVEKLLEQVKTLERELRAARESTTARAAASLLSGLREVAGTRVLASRVEVASPGELRSMVDRFKQELKSGVIVLGAEVKGKAALIVGVTDDLADKFDARRIIEPLAELLGGKGGGRADMAQAGGPNADTLDDAVEKAYEVVEKG